MTIELLGYPVSNYVNVVRAALIEKRLPYTLSLRGGGREDEFLDVSPMGKIPVLVVDGWSVTETVAILEWLEDRFPEIPLRPFDLEERARARQIVNLVQLYVEAPARALFPGVFMGDVDAPAPRNEVRAMLDRSTAALARLVSPDPYLVGGQLSGADLFTFYNLDITDRLSRFLWQRSIIEEAGLAGWSATMQERASTKTVLRDFEDFFATYLTNKGAAYRPPSTTG